MAHSLTEINVQAGAAAERLEVGVGRAALERIEDASRRAIGELRAVLGVLRDPQQPGAPLLPAPGVMDISDLVDRARDTGLDVRLQVAGEQPPRLSDGSSLAAYRIIQESLTNARRHAPGVPVIVGVTFGSERMSILVQNPSADQDDDTVARGRPAGDVRARHRRRRHPDSRAHPARLHRARGPALPAATMIRVLVADDQAAVRDGFAALVAAQAGAERSGSRSRACLMGMDIAYVVVTIMVALANSYAAVLNFAGAESVKVTADRVRVSQKWMIPFGILLACGAVGLLTGFAVPALGTAAAIGLVAYFISALSAHIRVHDPKVAGAVSFLVMAVAALVVGLGYHYHW